MLKRYSIWDKQSVVITPSGEIFTAEQWIDRYPVAALPNITVVGAAGEINGGYFGTLGQMVQMYKQQGCDFSDCTTDVETLERIEEFEDFLNTPEEPDESTPEERIAAALELNNLLNMPTINDDDPDLD